MTQLSLFSGRVSELDKLDEFVGVMGQIQSFLVGDGPDAPLLHGQGAKEDFDWFALLIGTDVIEDIGVGGDGLTFDFGLEDGKETSQWTSIRFEANRLLGTMPPNGLQVYDLQFGGKARDLLAEARKSPDLRSSDELRNQSTVEILADVAQRFLHTKAGSEAAEMLGTFYLDRGQPVMATLCFERLLGSYLQIYVDGQF